MLITATESIIYGVQCDIGVHLAFVPHICDCGCQRRGAGIDDDGVGLPDV